MTTTPSTINDQYYQESLGSITGFDSVSSNTSNPNIPVVGWSVEQLTAFLTNQSEQNFPSKDWIISVETEIDAHIANLNNPHQVSVNQIATNFVEQILQQLIPATIPITPPFYSFSADAQLPIGDVFPATISQSNLYRLKSDGSLENNGTVTEYIGTDYGIGVGSLPLFASIVNTVSNTWESSSTTALNTTLTALAGSPLAYCPGTFYTVAETPVSGLFGVNIPTTNTANTVYTLNVFLLSAGPSGSVKIQESSDSVNYALVDLDNGSSVASSSAVQVVSQMYPNGVIKVSYAYTAPAVPTNLVSISFYDTSSIVGPRSGLIYRNIFSLAYPTITQSPVNHPTIVNYSNPAISGPLVLTTANFITPAYFSEFMMTMSLWIYPALVNYNLPGISILSMGPLTITRDYLNIYVQVSGVTVFTSAIQPGLNKIALSYSNTQVICKDQNNPRVTTPGTYPNIPTSSITMGPFGGYLLSHSMYSIADYNQCLEFLVNG